MDADSIRAAYRRYARFYDPVFGNLLASGRHAAVKWINRRGGLRVLEVGVGTGISLSDYRKDNRVVGIDLSSEMLRVAQDRVDRERLENVEGLLEMDAGKLAFADGSFDLVVAMYVMTVVPDPQGTMNELERVCRPGGDILIVNHFAADKPGIRRSVENWMAPFSKKLGWRPDFTLDTLMSGSRLKVEELQTVPPFGLFSLLHCRREAATPA
ncbi:SAM-dependent methyltransferase (plasmid) [Azospirillum baldaniorum]|uniref:Methyltransferase domain-containing protein n=3 Tax=Azospirillum TaxID=191 RepID=A0A235HB80_AZOBR|nr:MULTISPECIES: methyltransferase domain-containing protein [Azospirillum]AWJ93952.1 SAM-dependent methyltransferase [Azospirillum baldaniorum]MBY3756081.1 methyltransferase domain-containing protein [Azospirillum formosense]NUB22575.1 methyltransferase domain-containing protein [Azospirillum formosense]OYD83099.1 SAM-dependent methyltransferase [Azospirillum brasilense]QCO18181.1 methyltransferase domain-containing protein [Azospirillum brasilense]